MKLYYGSETLVIKPTFGLGNPSNDYGLGFYLTPDYNAAKLWASKNKNGGYIITYEVDINKLKILRLDNTTELDVLKWITILVSHRFSKDEYELYKNEIDWLKSHFYPDIYSYDLIIGYRADDSYFAYSRSFVANTLSLESLSEAMKLGKLGLQYVLISKKAFEHIKYKSHEFVKNSADYNYFREKTLEEYRNIAKNDDINNTFIRDIMRRY